MSADETAKQVVIRATRNIHADAQAEFSEAGLAEFSKTTESYLADLLDATYRETRSHHADRITPAYVRAAADRVSSPRRRILVTFLGAVGGIFLGSAIAMVPSWLGTPQVSTPQALTTLAFAIGGAVLMVGAFVYEFRGR